MRALAYSLWCIHTLLESLPVSSSGHMTLITNFLQKNTFSKYNRSRILLTEQIDHLMHVTTAWVLTLFLCINWWPALSAFPQIFARLSNIFLYTLIGDTITVMLYFLLKYTRIKQYFPLWAGFLVTSVLLFSLFIVPAGSITTFTMTSAALLGLVQGLALLPGISRLASTYVAGCWLGLTPSTSFIWSCTLQLPLVLAAVSAGIYSLYTQTNSVNNYFTKLTYTQLIGLVFCTLLSFGLLWIIYYAAYMNVFAYSGFYTAFMSLLAYFFVMRLS